MLIGKYRRFASFNIYFQNINAAVLLDERQGDDLHCFQCGWCFAFDHIKPPLLPLALILFQLQPAVVAPDAGLFCVHAGKAIHCCVFLYLGYVAAIWFDANNLQLRKMLFKKESRVAHVRACVHHQQRLLMSLLYQLYKWCVFFVFKQLAEDHHVAAGGSPYVGLPGLGCLEFHQQHRFGFVNQRYWKMSLQPKKVFPENVIVRDALAPQKAEVLACVIRKRKERSCGHEVAVSVGLVSRSSGGSR